MQVERLVELDSKLNIGIRGAELARLATMVKAGVEDEEEIKSQLKVLRKSILFSQSDVVKASRDPQCPICNALMREATIEEGRYVFYCQTHALVIPKAVK